MESWILILIAALVVVVVLIPISRQLEQGAEALSVDHRRAVQHYRAAHETARRNQRNALTTDELRAAMEDYEVVFEELIGRS